MREADKRIFYGIIILAIFFLTAFTTLYYNPLHEFIDALKLTPFLIVISLVVGAGTYAFMSEKLEKKEHAIRQNVELILRFLNEDERRVIEKLVEDNGRALQSEITRLPGMSKLRSHRIVRRLVGRRIVEVEGFGKTNVVRLAKEVREALF